MTKGLHRSYQAVVEGRKDVHHVNSTHGMDKESVNTDQGFANYIF